jgi:hypothetical protein
MIVTLNEVDRNQQIQDCIIISHQPLTKTNSYPSVRKVQQDKTRQDLQKRELAVET